ncbi:unknown protein [Seminavis robusta]|uniref:Uncharacterized protein n=1 Tax=Seminavis robusta TaxID=568900 RepID=A0A9N8HIN2_9STRA|nr:unknown protein [Seminavis robusta]|eukprot:Sro632_g178700.1 n/a (369) ;mRNA; r:35482-36751
MHPSIAGSEGSMLVQQRTVFTTADSVQKPSKTTSDDQNFAMLSCNDQHKRATSLDDDYGFTTILGGRKSTPRASAVVGAHSSPSEPKQTYNRFSVLMDPWLSKNREDNDDSISDDTSTTTMDTTGTTSTIAEDSTTPPRKNSRAVSSTNKSVSTSLQSGRSKNHNPPPPAEIHPLPLPPVLSNHKQTTPIVWDTGKLTGQTTFTKTKQRQRKMKNRSATTINPSLNIANETTWPALHNSSKNNCKQTSRTTTHHAWLPMELSSTLKCATPGDADVLTMSNRPTMTAKKKKKFPLKPAIAAAINLDTKRHSTAHELKPAPELDSNGNHAMRLESLVSERSEAMDARANFEEDAVTMRRPSKKKIFHGLS